MNKFITMVIADFNAIKTWVIAHPKESIMVGVFIAGIIIGGILF